MNVVSTIHSKVVFNRRTQVLAEQLIRVLPLGARVLDVGCGDGTVDRLILERRDDLVISGIDVLIRPQTHIPVALFDGHSIPFVAGSFDVVMFVDVLHHTVDPSALLAEARRVSTRHIVLKDHTKDGFLAGPTLRLMDWVGNAHHGVVLPYNYWTESQWRTCFRTLGIEVEEWNPRIGLYPRPAGLLFERSLHFIARLKVSK